MTHSYSGEEVLCNARVGDLYLTPHEKHIIVVTVSAITVYDLDGIILISYKSKIDHVRGQWLIGKRIAR